MANKVLSKLAIIIKISFGKHSFNLILFVRIFRYSDASSVGLCNSEWTDTERVCPMARANTQYTETWKSDHTKQTALFY